MKHEAVALGALAGDDLADEDHMVAGALCEWWRHSNQATQRARPVRGFYSGAATHRREP